MAPERGESTEALLARLNARLDEIMALEPSGEYYVRPRRIDDHNPFWRAGWPIPEGSRDHWERTKDIGVNWCIADTGTDRPVISASEEGIQEIWEHYLETGKIRPDPKQFKDERAEFHRQHHKPHHSGRHGKKH